MGNGKQEMERSGIPGLAKPEIKQPGNAVRTKGVEKRITLLTQYFNATKQCPVKAPPCNPGCLSAEGMNGRVEMNLKV